MTKTKSTTVKNKDPKGKTKNGGRITKAIVPKKTPRQIGQQLEVRTWAALHAMGIVTVRTQDGHYDPDMSKYVPTGDGGVDMIATTDTLTIYVQCKNWAKPIGADIVRAFYGALSKFNKRNNSIGLIVGNIFTDCAKNEAKDIKEPSVILTTPEDIGRTITRILREPQTTIQHRIKIEGAEFVQIRREGEKIIGIGSNVKIEISNE
jgi:Restriction endonuclease